MRLNHNKAKQFRDTYEKIFHEGMPVAILNTESKVIATGEVVKVGASRIRVRKNIALRPGDITTVEAIYKPKYLRFHIADQKEMETLYGKQKESTGEKVVSKPVKKAGAKTAAKGGTKKAAASGKTATKAKSPKAPAKGRVKV